MKKIKAIIFDMDGVIADMAKLNLQYERAVCKKYKINIPLAEWKNFHDYHGFIQEKVN